MASSKEQRVFDALQQLVSRLVPPTTSGEDEAAEDERWEEALGLARKLIGTNSSLKTSRPHATTLAPAELLCACPFPVPARAHTRPKPDSLPPTAEKREDTSHAADLIRAKLVRDTGRPEKATRFSGLYSRLLTQPVLGQKWGILYFLYRLAEIDGERVREGLERVGMPARTKPVVLEERARGYGAQDGDGGEGAEREREERVGDGLSSREGRDAPREGFARRGVQRIPREGGESLRLRERRERVALGRKAQESQEQDIPRVQAPAEPKEAELLRDLPFTLQGLESTHLPFRDEKTLSLPRGLPVPLVSLLHALAEPSLLYRKLARFVDGEEGGLVGQSLRSAIGEELKAYLGLVATLENQIRKALEQVDENMSRQSLGKAGVTLKRCVVWTRDATLGLRLMNIIVEESTGKKGGHLITLIHDLSTSHGDPFVHSFANRLLHKVTEPFYIMLQHWIFSGDLQDPFSEFLVLEKPDTETSTPSSVWTDKYELDNSLVPSIMTPDQASQVFLIGKSLNFIRSSCLDASWVESYTARSSRSLSFSDPTTLQSSINAAYKETTARVLELMSNKFHLFDHLSALKKYLLLGQGDFIAILLESLASNLDAPANAQYRHHLTSALDHSIRNSNAQYEAPDITRRLDARMLELSHGEIGWDVFTLEYRMDSPLDVVVGAWAQKQYLKIFNFLWRIKRVEFTLGQVWGRCMTGSRGVLRFVGEGRRNKKSTDEDEADDELKEAWKRARGGLAAMVHFVGQLQYYILFEVIESGWEKLKAEMAKPTATLDTLISAHTTYLHNITRKGLLAPAHGSSTAHHVADFTSQLHELIKLMLGYKDAIDALYSHSLAEFTRRGDQRRQIDRRTDAGRWGLDDLDPPRASTRVSGLKSIDGAPLIPLPDDEDVEEGVKGIDTRLAQLETDFRARVNVLLGDLAYQQDTDMRFLGVVMNFNDVYRPVRRRRGGKEKERREGEKDAGGLKT
ncbi:Gamma tubulin complex component C-terminal-like protein [Elsinoe fawcettii]|nr:Gamma tubulin complex component C-terminal-like protein [Elsinoe fawcettii]